MSDTYRGYGGPAPGGTHHDYTSEPDPTWTAAQQRIEELEQQVSDMQVEKATLRQEVVAEIQSTASYAAAMNERLQAFNAEITPDMDGLAIRRLAQKHKL